MDKCEHQSDAEAFRRHQSGSQFQGPNRSKVVIQKTPSRLYLGNHGAWTPNIEKARMFDSGWEALEGATHLELQDFQLVPNSRPKE
jgi:hypothetical protein